MKMKELFDRGEFVVSAEVGPPKGIHVDELVEEAKTYLKGVHAVNVTDNSNSFSAMLMYLGIPFFLAYSWQFLWGIRQYFNSSIVSILFLCGTFIVFLNSEQIAKMTLFLFFLFPLCSGNEEKPHKII